MLQRLPGWECIGSKAEGPRVATVTQSVLATTTHPVPGNVTTQHWPPPLAQCWPPNTLSPTHPDMEGHPPLRAGHHLLLTLGHHRPPEPDHPHPPSTPRSQLPAVSHGRRDHQHGWPAFPTSGTRAQIQPISPQNCVGTAFNWENIRSGNSWLLLWQPPTPEIAGLGAGMVTAGTTRWVPGRSKQVLQKRGGALGLPRAPGSMAGAQSSRHPRPSIHNPPGAGWLSLLL